MNTRFKDRSEAGKILAEKLRPMGLAAPLILGLPRGGVPVAYEIAQALRGTLDVLLVKKIGAPSHEELALGAIGEDGKPYWNQEILDQLNLPADTLDGLVAKKKMEIERQREVWRASKAHFDAFGRTVVLVDDGLATGATMMAAVKMIKRQHPEKIIVAAPVASSQAVRELRKMVDEAVILHIPQDFMAVGLWYKNFRQVGDEEVKALLNPDLKALSRVGEREIKIRDGTAVLAGRLAIPPDARALIVFAHGSGSTHRSPRNLKVADALHNLGLATMLFDLLTPAEAENRGNVFNIELLGRRLSVATQWLRKELAEPLPIGYFGASTGAAAALTAAAEDSAIFSVVSRGGRPDLAADALPQVKAPTLLIVGGDDDPVVGLNEKANRLLKNSQIEIVPGAGHLFEEPGTMDKVIEYAGNWFLQSLAPEAGNRPVKAVEEIAAELLKIAKPFESGDDLDQLIKRMSKARVVMLGESSHGTEEFYETRRIISQKLIEDHGFSFIAVEGDWPPCQEINRYLSGGSEYNSATEVMAHFSRWPTWMWANYSTAKLIEWMKGRRVGFFGLDVYSLYESLAILKNYSSRVDPVFARSIAEAYGCFEPYERTSETSYASALMKLPYGCRHEAMTCLNHAVRTKIERTTLEYGELFDARQNAFIVKNAERYYRAMVEGRAESWNVRDEHMMETLNTLLNYHGEGARAIVWAHNTHIGDYHGTDMIDAGYLNLGGLARERYGIENVCLVGFGTYEGEVLAGRAWESPPEIMRLLPAKEGSYEAYLHAIAAKLNTGRLYFELNDGEQMPALSRRRGHRAVGVIYQTQFEARGHNYVPTDLASRYDAFIFIDKTSALKAVKPLRIDKDLLPETWPAGQ